jgi:glycosyltransferase involved in cell wall biosynthesis
MTAADAQAAKAADSVWVSARGLVDYLRRHRPDVRLFANVADVKLFKRVADYPYIPRTMVFAGALSAHKVDLNLLLSSARALPNWNFSLVGPDEDAGASAELKALRTLPNVRLHGRVPHEELPRYLAEAEVLLLPYRISEHTAHVLPLKLFEYLATGRRVASVPLPAVQEFSSVVEFFSDATELVSLVNEEDRGDRACRIGVAELHDWENRIEEIERDLLRGIVD